MANFAVTIAIFNIIITLATSQRPTESGIVLNYSLHEETATNQIVGSVSKDSGIRDDVTPDVFMSLSYNFLPEGYPHTELFSIDASSGGIRTRTVLDRESLCPGSPATCILNLLVGVLSSSGQYFQIFTIYITLLDANDHSPEFPQAVFVIQIPESSPPGAMYPLPSATDEDSGTYSVQVYTLEYDGSEFSLQYTRDEYNALIVNLVLNSQLDHETQTLYALLMTVYDGGSPPRSATIKLEVIVNDSNDHTPEFTKRKYEVSVFENVAVDTVILNVNATDKDLGMNGKVIYRFSDQTMRASLNVFAINNNTGAITLLSSLDYEKQRVHQITVEAVDMADAPLTSQAVVVVTVMDINDNSPRIHFNLLSELSEAARFGILVAHVTVTDTDSGSNGQVTCRLNTTYFILERIHENDYKLLLNTTLDVETTPSVPISILCRDHGDPILNMTRDISLDVQDVNEYSPRFLKRVYHAMLAENNTRDQALLRVSAIDDDVFFSRVTYSLTSEASEFLSIGQRNGLISTKYVFDREQVSEHVFHVVAMDNGSPPLSSTATIVISVSDINDVAPRLLEPGTIFNVPEHLPADTVIAKLNATDLDLGESGKFVFQIQDSLDLPFEIGLLTGILKTTRELDREQISEYNFVVIVTDRGSPMLSGLGDFTVSVTDVNDHNPVFEFPGRENFTVQIPYNAGIGVLIANVKAYDADSGSNGRLRYSIVYGNQARIAKIDSISGNITFARSVAISEVAKYNLGIMVSDGGDPSKTEMAHLILDITIGNTTVAQVTETSNTNLIIIICLSVITVFFAGVVILAICFIKRRRPKLIQPTISTSRRAARTLPDISRISGLGNDVITKNSPTDKLPDPKSRYSLSPASSNGGISVLEDTQSLQIPSDNTNIKALEKSAHQLAISQDPRRASATALNPNTNQNKLFLSNKFSVDSIQPSPAQIADMLHRLDARSDSSGEGTSDSGRGHSEDDNNCSFIQKLSPVPVVQETRTTLLTSSPQVNRLSQSALDGKGRVTSWMHSQRGYGMPYRNTVMSDYGDKKTRSLSNLIDAPLMSVTFNCTKGTACNIPNPEMISFMTSRNAKPPRRSKSVLMLPMAHTPLITSPINDLNRSIQKSHDISARNVLDDAGSDVISSIHDDQDDGSSTTTSGSYVVDIADVQTDINLNMDIEDVFV